MSKQESSKKSERPPIYDKWDADGDAPFIVTNPIGQKEEWQKYPCIILYSRDYAVIAVSNDEGKIVDRDGRTLDKGHPGELIWKPGCYIGQTFKTLVDIDEQSKNCRDYLFWKSKYPELLTR